LLDLWSKDKTVRHLDKEATRPPIRESCAVEVRATLQSHHVRRRSENSPRFTVPPLQRCRTETANTNHSWIRDVRAECLFSNRRHIEAYLLQSTQCDPYWVTPGRHHHLIAVRGDSRARRCNRNSWVYINYMRCTVRSGNTRQNTRQRRAEKQTARRRIACRA